MPNPKQKQGLMLLSQAFLTRKRAFLVGGLLGLAIALLFLTLSLKTPDSAGTINPYRWLSKPHESIMVIFLVLETKLFIMMKSSRPTLEQVVALFCIAHVFAAIGLYGVLTLAIREIAVRILTFVSAQSAASTHTKDYL